MTLLNDGATYEAASTGSGSGNYDAFLRLQATRLEEGFNTDANGNILDNKGGNFTHNLMFTDIEAVDISGTNYMELRLDVNEDNGDGDPLRLTEFKLWVSEEQADLVDYTGNGNFDSGFSLAFDLSGFLDLEDVNEGSGFDDYVFHIPMKALEDAIATAGYNPAKVFVTLYSSFSAPIAVSRNGVF